VLSGRIMRGVTDRIDAVIWFSDLRGFTRITDSAPEQVIPLLNDYADVIVLVIHAQGGDVLKLIGDGILAIFAAADRARACAAALAAATAAPAQPAARPLGADPREVPALFLPRSYSQNPLCGQRRRGLRRSAEHRHDRPFRINEANGMLTPTGEVIKTNSPCTIVFAGV